MSDRKFYKITQSAKTETGDYYVGEIRSLDNITAAELLRHGWAELNRVTLVIDDAAHGSKAATK